MPVALVRKNVKPLLAVAYDAHAGLLLQRGLTEHDDSQQGGSRKTAHVASVCGMPASSFYVRAFGRWKKATSDARRFRTITLQLESRLFIGLAGAGMLETGCAISHSYGAPYIPGSSVKGVARAQAEERFSDAQGKAICSELFGAAPDTENPAGLAGLISYHDAWWVPRSAGSPLVAEVITTHHMDYYGNEGKGGATDFDSPVPNAQVATQGAFLFVMAGPSAWLGLAEDILVDALCTRGIGAKTRSGYGYFKREAQQPTVPTCEWVDEQITRLVELNRNAPKDEVLRGRQLAETWHRLPDGDLRRAAFLDICSRWQKKGWWDEPPGRARRVRDFYLQHSPQM